MKSNLSPPAFESLILPSSLKDSLGGGPAVETRKRMDGVVAEESRKRRLPLWMLGVAATDRLSMSENNEVNSDDIEEGIVPKCRRPMSKAGAVQHGKDVLLSDWEAMGCEESSVPIDITKRKLCQQNPDHNDDVTDSGLENIKHDGVGDTLNSGTKRRRKSSQQNPDHNDNATESGLENCKHNCVRNTFCHGPHKKGRSKKYEFRINKENEVLSPSKDDEDFTMEDLMSIAQEYVIDGSEMGQQQLLAEEPKSESQIPSRNDAGISLNASCGNERSLSHKDRASCHNSVENSTSEGVVVNPSMTGDPAQDMLDLFLGPLLKKPLETEKKVDTIIEDMSFALEFKKQNQNVIWGEEPVPLTKRKSTLKDKVALFLD